MSDTGIGIVPEFLPHVFERFRQADAGIARAHGGLGLGLSIAKQLTEMHGGTIEAASGGLGTGATFRLKLPLMIVHPTRDESERVHPRSSSSVATIGTGDLQGVHVLAVDDDADALSLLAELLNAAGAQVTTAQSAEEALRHLDTQPPSVLVSDLGMPQVDGFAAHRTGQATSEPDRASDACRCVNRLCEIRRPHESPAGRLPDPFGETDRSGRACDHDSRAGEAVRAWRRRGINGAELGTGKSVRGSLSGGTAPCSCRRRRCCEGPSGALV